MSTAFQLPEPLPAKIQQIVNSSVTRFEAMLRANLGMWAGMLQDKVAKWVSDYRLEVSEAVRQAYEAGKR